MEVNRGNFFWMLPRILDEAQNAQFVAIDIEMSGIASGYGHLTPIPEAYSRIKEASENYQILQIGLTFIRFTEKPYQYTTRTFSCYLSPLFPRGHFTDALSRHLDRQFSVSARSYSFLRRHEFSFSQAIDNGVHYLSREEQEIAEEFCSFKGLENERIDPLSLDEESQQWYSETSKQIGEYVNTYGKMYADALANGHFQQRLETVVQNPHGTQINGLQTRLIHQIIEEEYPTCNAKRIPAGSMAGSVSVTLMNRAFRVETETRRRTNVDETKRLSGLQIILEALSGGSFADRIDQEWVYHSKGVPVGAETWNEFNQNFNFRKCEANLKKNRPVVIGHNIFQDLAFIYRTFFHPLPPKVDDFLAAIHQLFPRIVDTKFMHRRGKHLMDQDRTLKSLDDHFARQKFPPIRSLPDLDDIAAGPHDAGYDSAMTASLFLRQTCYMFDAKKHLDGIKEVCYASTKTRYSSGNGNVAPPSRSSTTPQAWDPSNPFTILDEEEADVVGALKNYSVLDPDETFSREATPMASPTARLPDMDEQGWTKVNTKDQGANYSPTRRQPVPEWTDDFWRVYGNKSLIPGAGFVSFV